MIISYYDLGLSVTRAVGEFFLGGPWPVRSETQRKFFHAKSKGTYVM